MAFRGAILTAERHIHADSDLSVNRHALSLETVNLACQVHPFHAAQNRAMGWGNMSVHTRSLSDVPIERGLRLSLVCMSPTTQ
jgi:hypothetical protein